MTDAKKGTLTIPVDWIDNGNSSSPEVLEGAGVIFGDVVPDDPLFRYVELPAGWSIMPGDHEMWSHILDQEGRERAAIWCGTGEIKGAHFEACTRYIISLDWDLYHSEGVMVGRVLDGDKVIYRTKPYKKKYENHVVAFDAEDDAIEWLNLNFPNWENSGAYWD